MKVQIPEAHGQAIAERMREMQEIMRTLKLMQREDDRHVRAVLKSLGHDADAYERYDLRIEHGEHLLDLTERSQPPAAPPLCQPAPALAEQPVNGTPLPPTN
jgi:hypothetical protein